MASASRISRPGSGDAGIAERAEHVRYFVRPARKLQNWIKPPKLTFIERAATWREMQARVRTTSAARDQSSEAAAEWRAATKLWCGALGAMFDGDFGEALTAVRQRREVDIEPLLVFLEAEPWFFGSGYQTENVLRLLKRATLTEASARRIRALVLRSVRRPGWTVRSFWDYARLAAKVATSDFEALLQETASAPDRKSAERALHVLHVLKDHGGYRDFLRRRLTTLPELHTARLVLRQVQDSDAEEFFEQISSLTPDGGWLNMPEARSLERCRVALKRYGSLFRRRDVAIPWVIVDRAGRIVGFIEIVDIKNRPKGELAYWLGTAHRGQGLMAEAVSRVTEFAFTELAMYRLIARSEATNVASQRVLEKAGYGREGIEERDSRLRAAVPNAEATETIIFGRLRTD